MHEISLMKKLVAVLEREAADPGVGMVKTVRVEVGALRQVVPEIMAAAFDRVPKDGKLKEARLELSVIPVRLKCSVCSAESTLDDFRMRCGLCGGGDVSLLSGNEFTLKGVEW